jgi:hypothetical protein
MEMWIRVENKPTCCVFGLISRNSCPTGLDKSGSRTKHTIREKQIRLIPVVNRPPADGQFCRDIVATIKALQKEVEIAKIDGIFGPETLSQCPPIQPGSPDPWSEL